MVRTVGSRELKNRLGTYLRMIRAGARIIVTDRGRPVAELRPLESSSTDEEALLLELGALGLITPRSRATLPPLSGRVRIVGKPLSETISDEREDR